MANKLSTHAMTELKFIAREPLPRSTVNPGIVNKLLKESLVKSVQLPSPFAVHKGGNCEHLEITEQGRALLAEPHAAQ